MIRVNNMYDIVDLLTDLDEDSITRSFVGDECEVLELMGTFNECTDIIPDLIQFDSEEAGYYVFMVDRIGSDIVYSIFSAVNNSNGKFYGVNGDIFVSTSVPEEFEEDVNSYKHIDVDSIVRVAFDEEDDDECDGNCSDCPLKENTDKPAIYTEKEKDKITQAWTDGDGSYFMRSYYSSDKVNMAKIASEWEAFAEGFKK